MAIGGTRVHDGANTYQTVAASTTATLQVSTGKGGDHLKGILVVPATTSPGALSVKDGAGSAITLFAGGATSVADLKPFWIPLGASSTAGAWSVTTGANMSVVAVGFFS